MNIGRIVGTFGLKGQLKVEVMTDFPERFDAGNTVYLRGEPVKIKDLMWHQTQARIKLEGINKIDDAELLKWEYLQVPEDERPDMEKNEFYVSDLVGMNLETEEGVVIGTVDEIISAPAQDLIRFRW
jgi:16S rRNA processing protein RimM